MNVNKPTQLDETDDAIEGIPLVPRPSKKILTEKQQVDYASHRRQFLRWALTFGKDVEKVKGYSVSTMRVRASRVDKFLRWKWDRDEYTTVINGGDADTYIRQLAYADHSQDHKANTLKALKTYFSWLEDERGVEWEPQLTFEQPNRQDADGDALDRDERIKIREAALEYGSIPHYNSVDVEERDRLKLVLSRRFEKPKNDIGEEDWKRANGWKIPSLVWTALDCGLRPVEIERSTVDWLDLDRARLVIPKEGDVKVKDERDRRSWTPALTERTVTALQLWIEERECYEKYDDSDALWLNKEANPYNSHNLSYLLRNLADEAGIDHTNRDLSWYSIRRSTISEMVEESDLSTAAEQCRHRDIRSTRRYDQPSEDRRRDVLDSLG